MSMKQTIVCNHCLKNIVLNENKILGENNARSLLKSIQNHEILINNMYINMPDYFINTFFVFKENHISNRC